MSHNQDGNISPSNISDNNLNPIIPADPITKNVSKLFYLGKLATFYNCFTFYLYMKEII